jgi:predicted nucleic acid-binding protein
MAADPVFLDTNVLVAASVAEHPSHLAAVALLDKLTAERTPLCISPQVRQVQNWVVALRVSQTWPASGTHRRFEQIRMACRNSQSNMMGLQMARAWSTPISSASRKAREEASL